MELENDLHFVVPSNESFGMRQGNYTFLSALGEWKWKLKKSKN